MKAGHDFLNVGNNFEAFEVICRLWLVSFSYKLCK
jgi:hypothetical protein